jgi:hypothetical protein
MPPHVPGDELIVFGQNFDLRLPGSGGGAKPVGEKNSGTGAMCFVINVYPIAIESWHATPPFRILWNMLRSARHCIIFDDSGKPLDAYWMMIGG